MYAFSIGGFPSYDPRLWNVFRGGILLSLTGLALAISGVWIWRPSSLRWHVPACGVGTLMFWTMVSPAIRALIRVLEGNQCRIILGFMHSTAKFRLLGLQCFVVLFVALHNWIPLGKLNDVSGVRKEFPGSKLLITTLINFTPYAFGLCSTICG